jgi:ATP-binding cassette subfamily B protein
VLQDTFLFNGTVAENIAYARPEATREDIINAAVTANAHKFIMNLPDGYDTVVGERGTKLSGGERQRIAIARAVLHDPKILILDEATASVDTETESKIQMALGKLVKGRTTIAIAHRLSTLRHAHRLVVLEKGKVKEEGTHAELMEKKDGVYKKLVDIQTEWSRTIAVGG